MKTTLKILTILLILFAIAGSSAYYYLQPSYSGNILLKHLKAEVEVIYDKHGVPHIYAQSEEDAYRALGYAHAKDRLFQMELIRRAATGRLSEMFGEATIEADKMFRTLGLADKASKWVTQGFNKSGGGYQTATLAYLEGVNQYLFEGQMPPEFHLLKLPKDSFTLENVYHVAGYMAFGFAQAQKVDPIVTKIKNELGEEYLKDWILDWNPKDQKIPVHIPPSDSTKTAVLDTKKNEKTATSIAHSVHEILENLPVAPFIGSNAWVLAGSKTALGKVILANDTHIRNSMPGTWFEAHIEAPNFSLYGAYFACSPFAMVGHNDKLAWGLTMFENDDIDFYREKVNPENANQVWFKDHWEDLEVRLEVVKVKDGEDVTFEVRTSRHGPIMNDAMKNVGNKESAPTAMWWVFNQINTKMLEAAYQMNHSDNIEEFEAGVSMIEAPGLNVMYGDQEGNIAWWAAAKLPKRPDHVHPKMILDGASGEDEILGYYDFEENPRSINPPSGFVYSANNKPDSVNGKFYAGYYVPEDRGKRIVELLRKDDKWTVEKIQAMQTDVTSTVDVQNVQTLLDIIADQEVASKTDLHEKVMDAVGSWDGSHTVEAVAPTIYYKWLIQIVKNAFEDELGQKDYRVIANTFLMRRTISPFLQNDSSIWWNNVKTKELMEDRKTIVAKAFDKTVEDLQAQLGGNVDEWKWGKVHTISYEHPLGAAKPLNKLFNHGPFPVMGGNETINNMQYILMENGKYKVLGLPALRFIRDFAEGGKTFNINPSGQSGNPLSPFYADQIQMYINGEYRTVALEKGEIEGEQSGRLILKTD